MNEEERGVTGMAVEDQLYQELQGKNQNVPSCKRL